jgi:predicted RNA-binding protein with TRAM domain
MKPILPPVKKGDITKLKVLSVGKEGDGVAKVGKFIVFIDKPVEVGRVYRVLVRKVMQNYAFAKTYFDAEGKL